jgi:hypothetical protein
VCEKFWEILLQLILIYNASIYSAEKCINTHIQVYNSNLFLKSHITLKFNEFSLCHYA